MSRIHSFLAALLLALATVLQTASATSSDQAGTHGIEGTKDESPSLGVSFYRHINGRWLAETPIPADHAEVGSLQTAIDGMDARLRLLIEGATAAPPDANAGKVSTYYRAFESTAWRDRLGLAPIRPLLTELAHAPDRRALATAMGREQVDFTGSLLDLYVDVDHSVGRRYGVFLTQSGLLMPGRDYYLDAQFAPQRIAFVNYVTFLLKQAGVDGAVRYATELSAFETAVARASWSDEQQTPQSERHLGRAALRHLAPGLDWSAFLRSAGIPANAPLIVLEPGAARSLAALFARTPVPVLRAWATVHALDRAAPFLTGTMLAAWQRFHEQALAGSKSPLPSWQVTVRLIAGTQCVGAGGPSADCFGSLRWAVGDLYMDAYFPSDTRRKADTMIADLRSTFRARVAHNPWMSPGTKAEALRKIDAYTVKLGGPAAPADLSDVAITADDIVDDARAIATSDWKHQLVRLHESVDPFLWVEAPQSIDANNGESLDIEFPAGLFQLPVFDVTRDAAYNFGAMGAFIGHEFTHALDAQGRHIDATNRRRDWWTAADGKAFEQRTGELARQYNSFEPLPGKHVDGRLTLSEDIADLGGVSVALDAYHVSLHGKKAPLIDGLTGDQRVFIGWASLWRGKKTAESLRQQIATDVHAPYEARVDGVVRNMDEWYAAFGVMKGEPLYLPPAKRVRIW